MPIFGYPQMRMYIYYISIIALDISFDRLSLFCRVELEVRAPQVILELVERKYVIFAYYTL